MTIDGWRIDAAPPERQGMMAAVYQLGYRLAMLCAGAGALYIADFVSWRAAYLAMAGLMAGRNRRLPAVAAARLAARARPRRTVAAFVEPLADLVRRYGATLVAILALVAIYRLPDFVSGVMANPLYIDLGFSKSDIATVSKLYGVWIGMAGAFGGGVAVARLGLMPSLLIGGFAASASHLTLAYLAASGAQLPLLTLAVSVESFASGFAGAALIAYMSSLVSPAFAATQYALLSSLYALPGKFVGGLSGVMVDAFGYVEVLRRHRDDRRAGGDPDSDRLAAGDAREDRTAHAKIVMAGDGHDAGLKARSALLHVLDLHRASRQPLRERGLHERIEVAVEHFGRRARGVAGAQVLDHLVGLQHVGADLVAPADVGLRGGVGGRPWLP